MRIKLTKTQIEAVGWMIQDMIEIDKDLREVQSKFGLILTSWFGPGWKDWDTTTLSVEVPDVGPEEPGS